MRPVRAGSPDSRNVASRGPGRRPWECSSWSTARLASRRPRADPCPADEAGRARRKTSGFRDCNSGALGRERCCCSSVPLDARRSCSRWRSDSRRRLGGRVEPSDGDARLRRMRARARALGRRRRRSERPALINGTPAASSKSLTTIRLSSAGRGLVELLLESWQRAAIEAVRKFVDTVDQGAATTRRDPVQATGSHRRRHGDGRAAGPRSIRLPPQGRRLRGQVAGQIRRR